MDAFSTYDNFPWELIAASLQDGLSEEEAVQLEQWLSSSPVHREKYGELKKLWAGGLTDYELYCQANAEAGWSALQQKIGLGSTTEETGAKIVQGRFSRRMRMIAAAAIVIIVAGFAWWFFPHGNKNDVYATAGNEHKKISLPDGSTIVLQPQTRIEVLAYDEDKRTVMLHRGEAFFEVTHEERRPFVVNMESLSVKDIGTSFTVRRTQDSINVAVFSGKVSFSNDKTGEAKEMEAGSSLCFYVAAQRFGNIRSTVAAPASTNALRFNDMPLLRVLDVFRKVYGKNVQLSDTAMAQERFNANLEGESFENSLNVLCSSLNLEYVQKNGVYFIKKKDTAATK